MTDRQDLNVYAEKVLKRASADQTEVLVYSENSALTRFSNEEIHQNVAEVNTTISMRSIIGKKIGMSTSNIMDEGSAERIVNTSENNARLSPEDPHFESLPKSAPIDCAVSSIDMDSKATPDWRAEIVKKIIERSKKKGLSAAGSISITNSEVVVANSLGSRASGGLGEVHVNAVIMGDDSSGYADYFAQEIESLNIERLIDEAIDKALSSSRPKSVEPGKYTVILEPPAVADMIGFLAYAGLGALSVQEKRSFMVDKMGKKLISDLVTIRDDANDDRTMGLPFDFEAVPKKALNFFDEGKAAAIAYDSYTANKEGLSSTGHALPAGSSIGPLPLNLVVEPGSTTQEEMIKSTGKGILVSRFHYTNLEDPLKTVFTGMTRDGTFLIENGKIVCGLKNLRFTQSILDALRAVTAVSSKGRLSDSFLGATFTPALKLDNFNFTGTTEF